MSIDVVISTSTSQIEDTNGVAGFGTITVYPAQPFSYYDGVSTINVTANATTISVQDGKFSSPTTLTLAPSKDASNNPETYYIVDIRVNGTFQRILWSIPNTPLTYEFSAVPQIANGTTVDAAVTALLNATDPFKQYVLRSDTLGTPVAGTASDGRGYIPRGDTTNDNKLDPSWLGGSGSGGELTAADIPVVDAGGYYTGTDVEAVEQEIGASLGQKLSQVSRSVYTTSGNYTPSAGTKYVLVECQGGGGGGGGANGSGAGEAAAGGGGGGGGYCSKLYAVGDLTAPEAYIVGAAGAGGDASGNADGTAGGNTTFKGMTAGGGGGGTTDSGSPTAPRRSAEAGAGGTASGGTINIPGTGGEYGCILSTTGNNNWTGKGGNSHLGAGARQRNSGAGNAGQGYGGGGSAGLTYNAATDNDGGAGAAGCIIITEYIG